MGKCNYCRLQEIRRGAKKLGQKVTILSDAMWGAGGKNVYVHPKDVKISHLMGGEDGERKKYRVLWAKEIPNGCCC